MKAPSVLNFPPAPEGEALADAPPELVALLAGRAPDAGQPSRAVLSAALLRIQASGSQRWRKTLTWSGWAAAACLAALFAVDRTGFSPRSFPGREIAGGNNPSSGDSAKSNPGSLHGMEPDAPGSPSLTAGERAAPSHFKRRETSLVVAQNMEQLRQDLQKLRAANEARFQGAPGLSRTVVVEMTDPSNPQEADRIGTLRLSERVAESIAAGVAAAAADKTPEKSSGKPPADETSAPATPPKTPPSEQDLVLSGGDGSWTGDIVIEKGLPNTGMINLPEGTQIKHLDFPVDDAASYRGLQDLGEGWFYDQFSDLLWKPTGEGRNYLGEKAPTGFDAESFTPPERAAPQMAEEKPAVLTQPVPEESVPAAVVPADPLPSAEVAAAPSVRGYPIFDETTGSGSIILQNLGAAGAGEVYQLWVTDPSTDQPISIGLLPQLDDGGGRVWFDLGGPGVAPSGYLLTLEPSTGSTAPTGRVVLKGP